MPIADLDNGRDATIPAAALAVEVATEPLVLEPVVSAPVVVADRVTMPVPAAVAVAVAVALALVLHQTSPGSEALIRHSARVPML